MTSLATALIAAVVLSVPVAASASPRGTTHAPQARYANQETSYIVAPGPRTSGVTDDVVEVLLNVRGPQGGGAMGDGSVRRIRRH